MGAAGGPKVTVGYLGNYAGLDGRAMTSMTGRLSVGCKSPLTATIKKSTAGGQAAQELDEVFNRQPMCGGSGNSPLPPQRPS